MLFLLNKAEIQADACHLRSEKLGDHEAEIEKIKSTLMAILKDIKTDIEDGKMPEPPATAEFLQTMQKHIQAARQEKKPIGAEDVITAMMSMVGQTVALDEKSVALFKQLAGQLFHQKNL